MNSAEYVACQIDGMKAQGMVVDQMSWEIAKLCIGWPYVFGDRGCYCTPSNRKTAYNRTAAGANKDNILKRCQVLNGSKGSCTGCKWYPEEQKVREFDCRGFTYWVLLQASGWKLMGAGCTSQWNDESNWKAKGELSESLPPENTIACVFWYKKDSAGRRTKTLEHTGLYFNGQTIECSNGVQFIDHLHKKWEVWGIPACSQGGVTPTPTPTPTHKTIKRGSKGEDVVICQQDLIQLGYDVGPKGADGIFGAKTEEAVKSFQSTHTDQYGNALKVDGIVGQGTWWALDNAIGPEPGPTPTPTLYIVTIEHMTAEQVDAIKAQYPTATATEERG